MGRVLFSRTTAAAVQYAVLAALVSVATIAGAASLGAALNIRV